ncbi:hypothetical protein Tco_0813633 [Tanacetum coccineum]
MGPTERHLTLAQQRTSLKYSTSFYPTEEGLRVWPRSSKFKRRLIAADQASVFMAMMSVHISSGLVLHQMTSDHNRSELIREEATHGIKTTANEAASQRLFQKLFL